VLDFLRFNTVTIRHEHGVVAVSVISSRRDIEELGCVVDALTAAELEAQTSVTVRSVDPVTRTPVRFTVGDEAMEVSPADAVVTFGIASSVPALESSDDSIFSWMLQADTPSVSAAFCQYINAFESADTYEQWNAETRGKTVLVQPQAARALIQQYVDLD
jgi:hypothetical protein